MIGTPHPSASIMVWRYRTARNGTLWIVLSAVVAIVADLAGWRWLHWLCKPLTTILILFVAWKVSQPVSAAYRRWIVIGIGGSLFGDICLMWPQGFVPGLLAFLFAHACFIAACVTDKPWLAQPLPGLLCLLLGTAMLSQLWAGLDALLRIAVPVYVVVLATMAGQAIGRAGWLRARRDPQMRPARLAAVGAVLFILSDSLLAWNRFKAPLPLATLWVLATYYMAQWLIARSVARAPDAA